MTVQGAFSIPHHQDSQRQRQATLPPNSYMDPLLMQFMRNKGIYDLLWDHFTGMHWRQPDRRNKALRFPLRINLTQAASFIHASCWAGDIPDSSSPVVRVGVDPVKGGTRAESVAGNIETLLEEAWYENHGRSLLVSASILAQAMGGVVLKVRRESVTGWRRKYPLRIEVVQPDLFVGLTNGSDMYDLLEAYVLWEIPMRMAELEYGYQRTSKDGDKETASVVEHWTRNTFSIRVNNQIARYRGRSMSGSNQLGFVPMVYFPHVRYAGAFLGVPIITQLMGLLEELNGRLADEGDAIRYAVHDLPWLSNVRESATITRYGDRSFLDLGTQSATSGTPSVGRTDAPRLDFAHNFNQRIESLIKQLMFTPEVAWGVDPGSQRSGESRDRLLLPLTMHVEMERTFWTPGLELLNEMIIRMLASMNYEKVNERYFNHRFSMRWHAMYPADRMKLVEEQVLRVGSSLQSPEGGMRSLGDIEDIDGVMNEIRDFKEWSSGLARPPFAGTDKPQED